LMFALDAEMSMKQMLFSMLETVPIKRNSFGKTRAETSIHMERFRNARPRNLNFFTSESKFWPYFAANRMPPSCPRPSLRTH